MGVGTANEPEVVVLRALGLGDFLTGVPALRALAEAFPDHRRVLLAPRALEPLVQLCGGIDELRHTPDLLPLHPELARPQVAVDLHGRGPASHDLLVDLRPDRLVAFADPRTPASMHGPCWVADEHEVDRWCRLLIESGVPADPSRIELRAPPARPPRWARGATVVHPGAAAPSRRWPASRFAAVAAAEATDGRTVLVTAGPREASLAAAVAEQARDRSTPRRSVPTGAARRGAVRVVVPPDLGSLSSLVAAAGRVVCGDTGVAHLATALRTPSVVLFGPVPPGWWGPPPERWWHAALWSGRRGDPHGRRVDPGLLEIGVTDVLAALARLPDRAPPPASSDPRSTSRRRAVAPGGAPPACRR